MGGIRPDKAVKFGCIHYEDDIGCNHPKTREIRGFIKSIHAIGQIRVPTETWTPDIVRRYEQAMSELPGGTDGCNLPTARVSCVSINDIPGCNPPCEDWECPGKSEYDQFKARHPRGLIMIR